MQTTQYTYSGCTLTYSITEDKKAIVGTNQSSSKYNAVTASYSSITLPSSITANGENYPVTEIGVKAFFKYEPLKNIVFPSSLVQINEQAFDLGKLEMSLTFGDSLKFIGKLAFASNSISNIEIGKYMQTIGSGAFGYSCAKTSVTVDMENPYFCSDNEHNLFDKRKRRLIQVALALTSFTIPSSVRIIDHAAFSKSSISKLIVPASVRELGVNCFSHMVSLETLIVYGNPNFVSACIAESNKLTNIYYCGTKLVTGEHITSTAVTVHTCAGYQGTTFAGKNIVSSDNCVAYPIIPYVSCKCRNYKMQAFIYFMIGICK